MPSDDKLRPASRDELKQSLAYALRFGRTGKTHRHANDFMAEVAADWLVTHLELSGFVVMKKPPALPPSAPPYGPGGTT